MTANTQRMHKMMMVVRIFQECMFIIFDLFLSVKRKHPDSPYLYIHCTAIKNEQILFLSLQSIQD